MPDNSWIWQTPGWPALTFDPNVVSGLLAVARTEAGRLLGKAEAIGLEERSAIEREVWVHEAVATAAIEGEVLDLSAVRSSVARRRGLVRHGPAVARNVEGLLDVMENASDAWAQPLTRERLCSWQRALFPSGPALREIVIGEYRNSADPMEIVSGPHGREVVHYMAVPGAAVRAEMHAFLAWFNRTREDGSIDGLLRAGLAHVWFESVHPFDDGNGRVGRAIVDLALAQDARRSTRLHGVATAMSRHQEAYYDALNVAQRGTGDVTTWLLWFLETYIEACREGAVLIDEALMRARFWTEHRGAELNKNQKKVLDRMLDAGPGRFEGGLTTRKYVALTGVTIPTGARHIAELVEQSLIVKAEGAGGRSTHYNVAIPGWEWKPAQPKIVVS